MANLKFVLFKIKYLKNNISQGTRSDIEDPWLETTFICTFDKLIKSEKGQKSLK